MTWLQIVGIVWAVSALLVGYFYVMSVREHRKRGDL